MQVFGDGRLRYPPPVKTVSRRSIYPAHRTQSRHQSSLFPTMVAITYSLTVTVLFTTIHHPISRLKTSCTRCTLFLYIQRMMKTSSRASSSRFDDISTSRKADRYAKTGGGILARDASTWLGLNRIAPSSGQGTVTPGEYR